MWNEYTRQKLSEFERERLEAMSKRPHLPTDLKERRLLAPVARAAGRRVRRLGEALEGWAATPQRRAGL